jgi:hypothetical protein
MKAKKTKHGTLTGYFSEGCRCEKCKAAASAYYYERKAKKSKEDTAIYKACYDYMRIAHPRVLNRIIEEQGK